MKYNFWGHAVCFHANHGRSHCTYLREDRERAMSYADSEGIAVGASTVEVWEVHAIPFAPAVCWSEETLPPKG
jgi:hypothetical protein